MIADAVRELGAEPVVLGIVADDDHALNAVLEGGLARCDVVLLSGGTSKGAGDLCYRVLARRDPGIIVHGVALKPGKPICLGAVGKKPVVILPGFPTSAIFTFHEFVAPLLRFLSGRRVVKPATTTARMPFRYNSEIGRTEYLLVNLVEGPAGLAAYPLGKGSGSVTTFSLADGFLTIPRSQEFIDAGEAVNVFAIGRGMAPCRPGGDRVALYGHRSDPGHPQRTGLHVQDDLGWFARRIDCSGAGRMRCCGNSSARPGKQSVQPLVCATGATLFSGYGRMQGIGHRPGDPRFEGRDAAAKSSTTTARDPDCFMVNRNRGSGTRILIDRLLGGLRPCGHAVEARSHNAVAAALRQGRADWGLLIEPVARAYDLAFIPLVRSNSIS